MTTYSNTADFSWLGTLKTTPEQRERIEKVAEYLAEYFTDNDEMRTAAISAAAEVILDNNNLDLIRRELDWARAAYVGATIATYESEIAAYESEDE